MGCGHIYGCGHKCGESVWGVVKCMGVVTSIGNHSVGCGHKDRISQCGVWSHAWCGQIWVWSYVWVWSHV